MMKISCFCFFYFFYFIFPLFIYLTHKWLKCICFALPSCFSLSPSPITHAAKLKWGKPICHWEHHSFPYANDVRSMFDVSFRYFFFHSHIALCCLAAANTPRLICVSCARIFFFRCLASHLPLVSCRSSLPSPVLLLLLLCDFGWLWVLALTTPTCFRLVAKCFSRSTSVGLDECCVFKVSRVARTARCNGESKHTCQAKNVDETNSTAKIIMCMAEDGNAHEREGVDETNTKWKRHTLTTRFVSFYFCFLLLLFLN